MIILSNCSESFVNNSAYNVKKAEKLTIDIDSLGISDLPFPHGSIIDFDKTVTVGNGDEWIGKIVLVNKNDTSDLFDFYRNEMPKYKYLNKSNAKTFFTYSCFIRKYRSNFRCNWFSFVEK